MVTHGDEVFGVHFQHHHKQPKHGGQTRHWTVCRIYARDPDAVRVHMQESSPLAQGVAKCFRGDSRQPLRRTSRPPDTFNGAMGRRRALRAALMDEKSFFWVQGPMRETL